MGLPMLFFGDPAVYARGVTKTPVCPSQLRLCAEAALPEASQRIDAAKA